MNNKYQIGTVVLNNWTIKKRIGAGSFGEVFEIGRESFGQVSTAALKVITVPQSPDEYRNQLEDGMSPEEAKRYFYSVVEDVVREFAIMSKLKGNTNVVSCEDYDVTEHADGQGWDILIRMELLTPLKTFTSKHPFTRRDIIRLGIDMLKALELCQKYNVIHRDIKPENIFVSPNGDFKLGDFGIARTVEKTTSEMSKKGTYTYMAPEVYLGREYGFSVDIYSLGLVMYRLLNKNMAPFLDSSEITHNKLEAALVKRMSGEAIPKPHYAEGRLGEIVLKACSYDAKDRYSSPMEMRVELEAILYREDEAEVIYPSGDDVDLPENKYLSKTPSLSTGELNAADAADATESAFENRPWGGTCGETFTETDLDRTESAFGPGKTERPAERKEEKIVCPFCDGYGKANYLSYFGSTGSRIISTKFKHGEPEEHWCHICSGSGELDASTAAAVYKELNMQKEKAALSGKVRRDCPVCGGLGQAFMRFETFGGLSVQPIECPRCNDQKVVSLNKRGTGGLKKRDAAEQPEHATDPLGKMRETLQANETELWRIIRNGGILGSRGSGEDTAPPSNGSQSGIAEADDQKNCPFCSGTGKVDYLVSGGFKTYLEERPCHMCTGAGKLAARNADLVQKQMDDLRKEAAAYGKIRDDCPTCRGLGHAFTQTKMFGGVSIGAIKCPSCTGRKITYTKKRK